MFTFQTIKMAIRAFGAWDYVIFALCLCFSVCIGIYHAVAGGKQKTTAEYYFGNRQMGLVPVALSLLVTYQSSIFLLGYPAETYIYGSMFWLSFSGVTIGFIMIALIIVPLFHPLEVTSSFEVVYIFILKQSKGTHQCPIGLPKVDVE